MESLINFQASHLDLMLVALIPSLCNILPVMEHHDNQEFSFSSQYDEMNTQFYEQSQFIKQDCGNDLDDQSLQEKKLIDRQKEAKHLTYGKQGKGGKIKKKEPYPTKNFLPNFKTPHLKFLQKFLKLTYKQFIEDDFIRLLTEKNGISLEDFERLYQTKQYHAAWEAMFKRKYLYHHLLLSRSNKTTKKNHARKIDVFEKAFRDQKFQKINY